MCWNGKPRASKLHRTPIVLGMVQGVGKNRIERDKRAVKFRLIMRSGTETRIFMVSWDALS